MGRKAVSRMGKMPQDLGFRGNPWSDWEYGSFVEKSLDPLGAGALLSSVRDTSIFYYLSVLWYGGAYQCPAFIIIIIFLFLLFPNLVFFDWEGRARTSGDKVLKIRQKLLVGPDTKGSSPSSLHVWYFPQSCVLPYPTSCRGKPVLGWEGVRNTLSRV